MKAHTKKSLRNAFISALVILLILIGGGVLYTWTMGQIRPFESNLEQAAPLIDSKPPVIEHTQPSENALVGVSVQSITSPVPPGSNVTITIRTRPMATCSITAVYNDIISKDSGLMARTADDFGIVTWTWTVEDTVPVGKWPVTVSCQYGKKSGMVRADLVVKT